MPPFNFFFKLTHIQIIGSIKDIAGLRMNAYYFCISIHLLSTFLTDSVTAFFGTQFYSKSIV